MMNKGFTLVEMLVSVAIFTLVMVMALGALLAMAEADRKAQTLKSVINNLNFALDSMTRSIRTGYDYHCGTSGSPATPLDCTGGTPETSARSGVAFFSPNTGNVTEMYCLGLFDETTCLGDATLDCPDGQSCSILRRKGTSGPYAAATSPEVNIRKLAFYVTGAENSQIQPKVTILISGLVSVSGGATTFTECTTAGNSCSVFNVQTSATQRLYDQ